MYVAAVIFFLNIIYVNADISTSPFCLSLCICDNSVNDVICDKELSHLNIWNDTKYWMGSNSSYPYRRVSITNSGIAVVTQIPKSPLQVLDLTHNRIQVIEVGAFSNLQNMTELILSNNQIETKDLHPDTLQGQYMEGSYNPLRSLKVLKLDGNIFHSLHQDFFQHTTKLEVLDLHANPLKYIDDTLRIALATLTDLKFLDLSYTQLVEIPQYIFHTLRSLEVLNLTANDLKVIPDALKDAHKLKYLSLNNNPIVNITEKHGFPKMESLETLHLCEMPDLAHIQAHSMNGLVNLKELYITDNPKLVHIDAHALTGKGENVDTTTWPAVEKLNLRNNKLSYLDHDLLAKWDTLKDIDVRDNPWACECETQWYLDILVPLVTKISVNKTIGVDCAAPIEMAEQSLYHLAKQNHTFRCLDYYSGRPERDAGVVIGILVGLLIGIPLVLGVLYLHKRNWLGYFDKGPAAYSRKFYSRTSREEGDF